MVCTCCHRLHREQSPPQPGQGLRLLLPFPADSPLPSLTFAEPLELFLLPPQVLSGHLWEHRACHTPVAQLPASPVAPCPPGPAGLSPGPCRMLRPTGTAARGRQQPRGQPGLRGAGPGWRCRGSRRGWGRAAAGRGGSPGSPMNLMAASCRGSCGLCRYGRAWRRCSAARLLSSASCRERRQGRVRAGSAPLPGAARAWPQPPQPAQP